MVTVSAAPTAHDGPENGEGNQTPHAGIINDTPFACKVKLRSIRQVSNSGSFKSELQSEAIGSERHDGYSILPIDVANNRTHQQPELSRPGP